jgi:hypothetical protein
MEADSEIVAIDRMEDEISPLAAGVARTRELIATLEMCHHKAERWVENITDAIGSGKTTKGLGTRQPGQVHPVERNWQNSCAALTAWCAGSPAGAVESTIGGQPVRRVLSRLGERSGLKEWQVHRVIERIRGSIGWPWATENAEQAYVPILESGGDYEAARRSECPDYYREHADYWRQTVEAVIQDTEVGVLHSVYGDCGYGEATALSLATAIDLLMPCHWNFVENLEILLGAIGGDLEPSQPYAFCARNIKLSPIRDRMKTVVHTLQAYCEKGEADGEVDEQLLRRLGKTSATKRWLAASLEKTIRLQLDL